MQATTSFQDILAWQYAHQFVIGAYNATKAFPEDEKFGLTSQFRRAAVSIAANIAEGYRKLSKADKLRFFNISQGSLEECRYYILLSKDLGYIDAATHDHLVGLCNKASWYLNKYADGVVNNHYQSIPSDSSNVR